MAQQYREMSRNATRMKASDIMDVHPETVRATMLAHQVRILIHGHTHRPGRHAVPLALDTGERIVLGDWYDQGSVLEYREGQYHLEQLALPGRDSVARL